MGAYPAPKSRLGCANRRSAPWEVYRLTPLRISRSRCTHREPKNLSRNLIRCCGEPKRDKRQLDGQSTSSVIRESGLLHEKPETRLEPHVDSMDTWTSTKLFVQMCCVTIPLSHGGIALAAELIGVPASQLSKLQISVIGVVFEIIQILGVWVLVRQCTESPFSIFKYNWDKRAFVQGCALGAGAIALVILVVLIAYTSGMISGPLEKPIGQEILVQSDIITRAMGALLAVVLGPFLEELIFRGLLLPLLADWLGRVGGIILSSVIFSAWHLSPDIGFQRLVSGCIFGAGYYWSNGNLVASTLGHSLYNLFIALISCWP